MCKLRNLVIGAYLLLIVVDFAGLSEKVKNSIDQAATLLLGAYLGIVKDLANNEEEEMIRAKILAEMNRTELLDKTIAELEEPVIIEEVPNLEKDEFTEI